MCNAHTRTRTNNTRTRTHTHTLAEEIDSSSRVQHDAGNVLFLLFRFAAFSLFLSICFAPALLLLLAFVDVLRHARESMQRKLRLFMRFQLQYVKGMCCRYGTTCTVFFLPLSLTLCISFSLSICISVSFTLF